MKVPTARANRILIAIGLGIALALSVSLFKKNAPDSAIARGDFPAFYTLAVTAKEGLGENLYELRFQQEIQGRYWTSLKTSVLPVAYPAFLASPLLPLAYLDPPGARIAWILINLLSTLVAIAVTCRNVPALGACRWQTGVVWLSFFPLLAGLIGGQAVGLSLVLLATIVALSRGSSWSSQLALGILCGLWMFKPHYALAVVWVVVLQRRGIALLACAITVVVLWLLGSAICGFTWVHDWFLFAQTFSRIDLATNSDQMTGVVAFLYSLAKRAYSAAVLEHDTWLPLSIISAAFIPILIWILHQIEAREVSPNRSIPYLAIAPTLLLWAPAANFYDLSLLLIPLSWILSPHIASDRRVMIAIMVLSAGALLSREHGFYGGPFLVSTLLGFLIWRRLLNPHGISVELVN